MADSLSNPIAQRLVKVATRLHAIAVIDGPDAAEELRKFRAANGNRRLYIVSPAVKTAKDDGSIASAPASAYVAGVFSRINFWESPSNQLVYGALGTSIPISFGIDDPESIGQQYNAMDVATLVRQDGLRVWGVRGTGDPLDLSSNQIQKVRIRDAIAEAITTSSRWAVAAGITADYFGSVSRSVDAFLSDLKSVGAIAGGRCIPDADRNTPSSIFDGKVYWTYDATPTPVADTLTFEEVITTKYLDGITA